MQRIVTALFILTALASSAGAQDGEWRHGTSLVEEPGYPPNFPHFNYVNPDAPKGGTAKLSGAGQTFDGWAAEASTNINAVIRATQQVLRDVPFLSPL